MLEVDTNRCMHVEQNREREKKWKAFGETECDAYEKRANLIQSNKIHFLTTSLKKWKEKFDFFLCLSQKFHSTNKIRTEFGIILNRVEKGSRYF